MFVHHFTACGVDKESAGAHQVQPASVDEVAVGGTAGAVQRYKIAFWQQVFNGRDLNRIVARQNFGRDGRAVLHDDLHVKTKMRALRHGLADAAKADDAERRAGHFGADQVGWAPARPAAIAQFAFTFTGAAGDHEH